MSDEIILKATTCHYNYFHGEYGCNNINLKLPRSEVVKLKSSVVSQDKPVPDIDYSVAAQFWGLAFTTTFFLWLFAKGIGEILKHVRNA
ncbi:hypothetical protein OQO37_11485 [Enterobacter hormaechei]|uniref:hypothetical protein n=1 Tax=Enterobacteriaceae TaxID=543 RepID=UPI001F31E760|nr:MULTISPECIES: hypothetical protein [Enterobacteriaceae]HCC5936581.1 hypothetical protein [Citrobacter freundii]MDG4714121.1 hypothetical protein [Enterobacter hormaechei]MDG4726484.1 hypothetical protein [Enterobacter hormaechei]UZQ60662.1 hypothetical protein OQO37_11320 [Enterobacter hormaechei]UZQ60673.1 hypothetical protein OQO37_11375 [Enterobacter hormaechei]